VFQVVTGGLVVAYLEAIISPRIRDELFLNIIVALPQV